MKPRGPRVSFGTAVKTYHLHCAYVRMIGDQASFSFSEGGFPVEYLPLVAAVMTILLFKKKMIYPRVFMDPEWCAIFFEGDNKERYDSCLPFSNPTFAYPGSLKELLPSEEELSRFLR